VSGSGSRRRLCRGGRARHPADRAGVTAAVSAWGACPARPSGRRWGSIGAATGQVASPLPGEERCLAVAGKRSRSVPACLSHTRGASSCGESRFRTRTCATVKTSACCSTGGNHHRAQSVEDRRTLLSRPDHNRSVQASRRGPPQPAAVSRCRPGCFFMDNVDYPRIAANYVAGQSLQPQTRREEQRSVSVPPREDVLSF
jgi:hypothetical protein